MGSPKIWIACIILACAIQVIHAGWPNFLCPTATNESFYFPCNGDCIHQHGADFGSCGSMLREDYNCYCGPLNGRVHNESLHCMKDNPSFALLCTVDCQCSHGAKGGVCNFDLMACECFGVDQENSLCPFYDVEGFALFTAEMAGTQGLVGHFTKPYLPAEYPYRKHGHAGCKPNTGCDVPNYPDKTDQGNQVEYVGDDKQNDVVRPY